jgi:SAM-dependent methyltransferase
VDLFNRQKILKKTKIIQENRPSHLVLQDAANTLLERFLWSSHSYQNILILGAYNYVFIDLLKKHLQKDRSCNIVIQYHDAFFDSEYLPFDQNSFDCVFSFFDIQWINDVPGYLKQIQYLLKPQGLFSAVFVGGQTFTEIKSTLYGLQVKMNDQTEFSMNFMPTIHASDGAALLQRAGFSNPISDRETKKYYHSWTEIHNLLRNLFATGFLQQTPGRVTKTTTHSMQNMEAMDNTIELVFLTALGTINQIKTLNDGSKFNRLTQ